MYSFFNLGARWEWVVNATSPGKIRYPLYRRLSGPQGLSGRGEENLAFTGIRSPDRPVRSESLYRLRYPRSVIYIHTIYSIYIYIYIYINIQVVWPFIKTPGVCSVLQQYIYIYIYIHTHYIYYICIYTYIYNIYYVYTYILLKNRTNTW